MQIVEPITGEKGRYHVMAHSQTGKYLVDLAEYDGHGSCTCKDYRCRIQPFRERNQIPARRYCKHIKAARERFLDDNINLQELLERTCDLIIRREILGQ